MDAGRNQVEEGSERRRRRQTTTLRLLDCLVSFSENVISSDRGTEEDPHLSFVIALQKSFKERTSKLEKESRAGTGVSIPGLLNKISSDKSKTITANDLAQMIATGSGDHHPSPLQEELLLRKEALRCSESLTDKAKEISLLGRSLFLEGKVDEAKLRFEEADEIFREAVLTLRMAEENSRSAS